MSEELKGEPKNVFVNSLIGYNNNLECMIYINRAPGFTCVNALLGLCYMLDEESQDKLKPIIDELRSYQKNMKKLMPYTLQELHKKVMVYLHSTYLREVRFARPKHRGGKLEV